MRTFATLSPLPGFRAWFTEQLDDRRLTAAEREGLGADVGAAAALADPTWTRTGRGASASDPPCSRPARATS